MNTRIKCEKRKDNTKIGRIFLEQREWLGNEKGTGEKRNEMQWGLNKVCYVNLMEGVDWLVERFKGTNEIQ